jgi:hypothetical protein
MPYTLVSAVVDPVVEVYHAYRNLPLFLQVGIPIVAGVGGALVVFGMPGLETLLEGINLNQGAALVPCNDLTEYLKCANVLLPK